MKKVNWKAEASFKAREPRRARVKPVTIWGSRYWQVQSAPRKR